MEEAQRLAESDKLEKARKLLTDLLQRVKAVADAAKDDEAHGPLLAGLVFDLEQALAGMEDMRG